MIGYMIPHLRHINAIYHIHSFVQMEGKRPMTSFETFLLCVTSLIMLRFSLASAQSAVAQTKHLSIALHYTCLK